MKVKQTWACPKCDYVYKSPTKIDSMYHLCPKAEKRKMGLKKPVTLRLQK